MVFSMATLHITHGIMIILCDGEPTCKSCEKSPTRSFSVIYGFDVTVKGRKLRLRVPFYFSIILLFIIALR